MRKIFFVALIMLLSLSAHARQLSAKGISECKNKTEAKCKAAAEQDALASLANQIYVHVESDSRIHATNKGDDYFQWNAKTSSNIPLIGAEIICAHFSQQHQYHCQATLETSLSTSLYKKKIASLRKSINQRYAGLKGELASTQLAVLNQLLNDLHHYQRLNNVLGYFAPEHQEASPRLTIEELQQKLQRVQQQPASLEVLAELIAQQVSQKNVLLRPVMMAHSKETTPFAAALFQRIKSKMRAGQLVNDRQLANFYLGGSYQLVNNRMDLAINLTDSKGNSMLTRVWQLPPTVYQDYRTQPQQLDFDRLLHEGYVKSDTFQVELQTNKGSRGVVFSRGESAKLFVKLNRSGYFYIVGHIDNSREKLSYLLEVNDEQPPYAFEHYVGPEDINKWIDISGGGFVIEPPLGTETLQVFASDTSFIRSGALPQTAPEGYYHVVGRDAKQTVTLTRGIVRKKHKSAQKAEAVIMMQTIER